MVKAIRIDEVLKKLADISDQTFEKFIEANPDFPSPITLGPRITAYVDIAIDVWLLQKSAFDKSQQENENKARINPNETSKQSS